jgi:hypothetical protein
MNDLEYSVARNVSDNIIIVLESRRLSNLSVGDIIVRDIRLYRGLIKWFKENHHRLSSFINILIKYDLPLLVYTHNAMDRRIARLKKFLRILKYKTVYVEWTNISLRKVFEIEYNALREIIDSMELVREDFHRPRDWVHQLIYPYLLSTLESFMCKTIWYEPRGYDTKYHISSSFHYNRYTNEESITTTFHLKNKWISLNWTQLMELLEKIIERENKKKHHHEEDLDIISFIR